MVYWKTGRNLGILQKKEWKMHKTATVLTGILMLGTVSISGIAAAAPQEKEEQAGEVLFKIHDVVPEKDMDGNVLYCNIGATFFNNTSKDMSNIALTLGWNDEVVGEMIDQEERAAKEQKRKAPNAVRSRYSTSGFTSKDVTVSLKLPPLKAKQQVSLKAKVDTDRCFLLLNDMDIKVDNCGTASMGSSFSRQSCDNMFRYVSPMNAEYYTEFKEISLEQQIAMEDLEFDEAEKELEDIYLETIDVIEDIAKDMDQTESFEKK